MVGTTGLASLIQVALLLTQEANVPTPSEQFCFLVRLCEQVRTASEKAKPAAVAAGFLFVGTTGFEPATPCTPCKCATGLRYVPKLCPEEGGQGISP
jgi:hypothetical protein